MDENKYGYKPPIRQPTDFVFGGSQLPDIILQPNGNWRDFLPEKEYQNKYGLETYNCVLFTILNCVETLHKKRYETEYNFSERFLAYLVGFKPEDQGTTPTNATYAMHKGGAIPEVDLPFSPNINTIEKYLSPRPMWPELIQDGLKWLEKYDFGYEDVFGYKGYDKNVLKSALQRSPIGVSVRAWKQRPDGIYYKDEGDQDNHFVMLYQFDNEDRPVIFDTYDGIYKTLDKDYRFGYAQRYWLEKKSVSEKISIIQRLMSYLRELLQRLQPNINAVREIIIKTATEEGVEPILALSVASCESGFDPKAARKNNDRRQSVDRGLFQFNSYWYSQVSDEVAFDAKLSTGAFCKAVKAGRLKDWKWSRSCWSKNVPLDVLKKYESNAA